ncbi:MAG: DUF58 domain-containing protein [Chloroflexi bacterium]|nr:DUF58 domain-containing protein [Chloroflexota bacterium]
MLTPRFYVLALFVPALLILAEWLPFLAAVAGVYGLGLLWLLWLDRRSAGTVDQFRVGRRHDSKLSLGAPNRITIWVESRAERPVALTIRDEPPLLFSIKADEDGQGHTQIEGAALLSATVPARESAELSYTVRPVKRGDFAFGNLNLRWGSPINLYTRQATIPAAAAVKVYPNLYEIKKYDLLARRDQLAEMGIHNVRLRGEGTAFESLRDYTPDDPYRSINWKATARRGKPISTDYEPERSQRVLVALDIGRMMRSPIRIEEPDGITWNMAKIDFVINSVLLFTYVATLRGDEVGLLVFADQVQQFLAPLGGSAQFHKILETMYALESQTVEANYVNAINYLRTRNRKRALVTLFTDLSGARASAALMRSVPTLAPRHLPMVVTIRDPALGDEAHQPPNSSDTVYRRAVAEQLIEERLQLMDTLRQRGVLTLDVPAQKLTMAVVSRYLELKSRLLI